MFWKFPFLIFSYRLPGVSDTGESFWNLNNSASIFKIPNGFRKILIGPWGVVWWKTRAKKYRAPVSLRMEIILLYNQNEKY